MLPPRRPPDKVIEHIIDLRIEEWLFEVFVQLIIAWIIKDNSIGSCVSTEQTSLMGRGYFTPYRIVWDPGDFTIARRNRDSSYKHYSLDFQEGRMKMGHDGQIVMIRVDVITYIVAKLPYSIFLDSSTLFHPVPLHMRC